MRKWREREREREVTYIRNKRFYKSSGSQRRIHIDRRMEVVQDELMHDEGSVAAGRESQSVDYETRGKSLKPKRRQD